MTILDFLGKFTSGRLDQQIDKLRQITKEYYLLIENPWLLKKTKWNQVSAIKLVASMIEHNKIFISVNFQWSLYFVLYFYKKYSSERQLNKSETRAKPKDMSTKDQALYALSGLTGIGEATALKLLMNYGSLKHLCKATVPDLEAVVNSKLAHRIYEVVNYQFS